KADEFSNGWFREALFQGRSLAARHKLAPADCCPECKFPRCNPDQPACRLTTTTAGKRSRLRVAPLGLTIIAHPHQSHLRHENASHLQTTLRSRPAALHI